MGFFRRKKAREQAEAADGDGLILILMVAEAGWRAKLVHPATGEEQGAWAEDCLDIEAIGPKRLEEVIGRAMKTLPSSVQQSMARVNILVDDPGIAVATSGELELQDLSAANIRQTGRDYLNCQRASFGQISSQGEESPTVGQAVIALIDQQVLRDYVGAHGKLAVKISTVSPLAALGVALAEQTGGRSPQAMLFVDAYHSTLVVVGGPARAFVSRVIDVGFMTLVNAVSKATNVQPATALEGLKSRDRIAGVTPSAEGQIEASSGQGVFERALAPALGTMRDEIEATLTYAREQRFAGDIGSVEIFGVESRINGLDAWLARHLPLHVQESDRDLLDVFAQVPTARMANLLEGSDRNLVTVGKVGYAFVNGAFVPEAQKAESVGAEYAATAQPARGRRQGRRGRQAQRGAGARGRRPQRGSGNAGGLLSQLMAVARPADAAASGSVSPQQERLFGILLSLLFFAVLYLGYTNYYAGMKSRYDREVSSFGNKLSANTSARKQLKVDPRQQIVVALDTDKVLWTEKMLSLGRHMDDKMWITDVYLTNENASRRSDESVAVRKLSIEGAVLPSTDGHILEIAEYIRRLTEDERFMADFSQITFEGAAIDPTESAHVVRFQIDAWYDEAKRIRQSEASDSAGGDGSDPTAEMRSKVQQRNNETENALRGQFGN
jgi:hypothetical protein